MNAHQIKDVAEYFVIYGAAIDAALILAVVCFYSHDNLFQRGKVLVMLTTLLMILSNLSLMLLQPILGLMYVVMIYPAYAMFKGDDAARIIMALYFSLSAAMWTGFCLYITLLVKFSVLSGDDDNAMWAFYVSSLFVAVGNLTSAILLFAARSIREFQKERHHWIKP